MMNNQVQRTTLTMKEASEYLGISYWLINQLVRKKQIPYCKVGGKYLFRVQALDEYLRNMDLNGAETGPMRKIISILHIIFCEMPADAG